MNGFGKSSQKKTEHFSFFPQCVAKGSRFTFGGLEVDACSRDPVSGVRNRPPPSATICHVRNRPRAAVVAAKSPCLWEKLQNSKRVFFDVSEDVVMSVCVAGVALSDIRRV